MRRNAILLAILILAGCSKGTRTGSSVPEGVTVCLRVENAGEKTGIGADGLSVEWTKDDRLCLWAYPSGSSSATLEKQVFSVYGASRTTAIFTSKLKEPMQKGTYLYMACCPEPATVTGHSATFKVSDVQNGRGEGIMVSDPAYAGALTPLSSGDDGGRLELSMHQKLHLLKFYLPSVESVAMGGESLQKIEATFSKPVTGTIGVVIGDASSKTEMKAAGNSTITLNLDTPLVPSPDGSRTYAYAVVIPTSFDEGDVLNMKLYSESHIAHTKPISLSGRNFTEGHATPVRISPNNISERDKIYLEFKENNIGEPVRKITLSTASGRWGDGGSNTYVYETGSDILPGDTHVIEYESPADFRSLSGQEVTASIETEHAVLTRYVQMPDLSRVSCATITLNTGWLLYEDFSTVNSFSSNDEHKTSSAGSKGAYSFLNGWTGGRVGASAGNCIRTACRRETTADYHARVDTAPLNAKLKKETNLKLEFDYGSNNKYQGIPIITDGNVGQNCYMGYTTSTKGYESGDKDGIYAAGNKFYTKEYTGSWTNTPNHAEYILPGVRPSDIIRIAIRTEVEHQEGTTNTTAWLYIDNVKVTICQ